MARNAPQLVSHLRQRLDSEGFDLLHPFPVHSEFTQRFIPSFDGSPPLLGLLIGNSRRLWPRFVRALAREPYRSAEHPLNDYVEATVEAALSSTPAGAPPSQTFFVHRSPFIPIQQIAVHSGLAGLAPCQLSIHPEYGPWWALRALVVVAVEPQLEPRPELQPCRGCHQPCVEPFDEARRSGLDPKIVKRNWRRWLAVREACPIGRSHAYGEEQIRFHYAGTRPATGP